MQQEPEVEEEEAAPVEPEEPAATGDVRSARPYLLSRSPWTTFGRRVVSTVSLVAIDIAGLTAGLFLALEIRSRVLDGDATSVHGLWALEEDWLPFLILLTLLVFWRSHLYGPRELREGAGRIVGSVFLVAVLALAFVIGTGQHFTTFGLYVAGAIIVSVLISVLRAGYEAGTHRLMRSAGIRRKALLVGEPDRLARLKETLGESRAGVDYSFTGQVSTVAEVVAVLETTPLDEVIVADEAMGEDELLQIVDAAHRHGVKVRIAPRTTELLIERGEYVPGQAIPLFELRPPIFAGADWAIKRSFDLAISLIIVVLGLPIWLLIALLIKLTSRGPVFYADTRVGLGEKRFRMYKFRTMVDGAADHQAALEPANEATGALFKIRNDPRVTGVGKVLRRFSLDELPNVLNVLRGEMSLVGPRPLPLRDFERLEPWHRRRYSVLPGMTGLWQVAGRSDLDFDDLVRLDFSYVESWSLWLDITILVRTVPAVLARRGAY